MKYFNIKCPHCGKITMVSMSDEEYEKYSISNELIQNIFPHWSPTDRELLITGICKDCQKEIFG